MVEDTGCCGNEGITETEEKDWLEGCIPFDGEERLLPEGSLIKSPGIKVLDLVRNFVVLRDGEIVTVRPAEVAPGEKILAVEPNEPAIKILNTTYEGRGIMLRHFDGSLRTYDAWPEGFAMWAVQSVRAGSGIIVKKPAGQKMRGVQTLPRAGVTPLQLSRLGRFQKVD